MRLAAYRSGSEPPRVAVEKLVRVRDWMEDPVLVVVSVSVEPLAVAVLVLASVVEVTPVFVSIPVAVVMTVATAVLDVPVVVVDCVVVLVGEAVPVSVRELVLERVVTPLAVDPVNRDVLVAVAGAESPLSTASGATGPSDGSTGASAPPPSVAAASVSPGAPASVSTLPPRVGVGPREPDEASASGAPLLPPQPDRRVNPIPTKSLMQRFIIHLSSTEAFIVPRTAHGAQFVGERLTCGRPSRRCSPNATSGSSRLAPLRKPA